MKLRMAMSAVLALFCWTDCMQAQEAADLKARLSQADALTSLDVDGLKPWHLKLEVQLCGKQAQPCQAGTIEEWWKARDTYRIEYVFPNLTATEMRNGKDIFRTHGSPPVPNVLPLLLRQVVHPLPDQADVDSSQPELRKENFGKVELECVMLDNLVPKRGDSHVFRPSQVPFGLFPTYCFDPGNATLRATAEVGTQMIVRNGTGKFLERQVAMSSSVSEAGHLEGSGKVVLLKAGETFPPELFLPDAALEPISSNAARIPAGVVSGSKVGGAQPIYPQSAKDAHVSGTVVLHAIIGRDGRIRNLRVVSTPDADLAIAALMAVRTWTYKPYLLNGEPTEVDTTVTVNFSFGG